MWVEKWEPRASAGWAERAVTRWRGAAFVHADGQYIQFV